MACSAMMRSADEIFFSLHMHLRVAGGASAGEGRRVARGHSHRRGEGSLPSLITIQFAYLYEGVH